MGFKFQHNVPISISYKYTHNTIDTFRVRETEVTGEVIEMINEKTSVKIIL